MKSFGVMSGLSNIFSVLNMDAEDDKEEVAPLAAAKNGAGAAKSGELILVIVNFK